MKLTTQQIHRSSVALQAINASTDLSILTAIRLANNIQLMETTVEQYNKRHDKVVAKYREETEEGSYVIPARHLDKFNTEKIKLDNECIDIKLSQISIRELPEDLVPSASQINTLRWLFTDLDEYLVELESKLKPAHEQTGEKNDVI